MRAAQTDRRPGPSLSGVGRGAGYGGAGLLQCRLDESDPAGCRRPRRAQSAYSAHSVAMASRTGIREARSAGHRAAMTPTTTESTSMPTIWPQGMLSDVSP